jgi:hypothetical protein
MNKMIGLHATPRYRMYIYIYIYIYILCVCVCVCVYPVYIYIYIYTYKYVRKTSDYTPPGNRCTIQNKPLH